MWGAPQLLPYTEEMLGKDKPVPDEVAGDPIMEFTMEEHDILYIPRGFLHEASTTNEPSLHVTVTIPTSDYCWGVQVVKHFLHNLHGNGTVPQQLLKMCDTSLAARGGDGPQKVDDSMIDDWMQEVIQSWASGLSADGVLDAFDSRMARTNAGQERTFMKAMEIPTRPSVTEDSQVRLMYGISCVCDPDAEVATFTRAMDGQQLQMKIAKSAARLIQSLTSKPQRVLNLPCDDAFERVCVLQLLHQQEVVQLFIDEDGECQPGTSN